MNFCRIKVGQIYDIVININNIHIISDNNVGTRVEFLEGAGNSTLCVPVPYKEFIDKFSQAAHLAGVM